MCSLLYSCSLMYAGSQNSLLGPHAEELPRGVRHELPEAQRELRAAYYFTSGSLTLVEYQ